MQSRVGGNLFIPLFKTWDRNYTAETFTFQFTVSNLFQTASRRRTRKEKVFKSDIVREISLDLLYVVPYHNGLRYIFGNIRKFLFIKCRYFRFMRVILRKE